MTENPFAPRSESDWRRAAEAALKGAPLAKLTSLTADGLPLGPIHAGRDGPRALRGEAGPWRILTRLDHPSPADFNAQALEDLENGADGLSVVFAGAGAAYGFGLSAPDAAAFERAFEGVRFENGLRVSLEPAGVEQAEAIARLAERAGGDIARADLAFGLNPLGAYARGAAAFGEDALKAAAASLARRGFAGPFAAADGRCIHDAGGTAAQELAFALSSGLAYLRLLEASGTIEFRLAADADQFVTIAKFRAMRLLWGRIEAECGLAAKPIRLSGYSAWRMMTVAEPYVNVMRATLAAFGAGLGGADNVTLLPFSQAVGLPDAFARRLARNTQLIELREARLGHVADPAGGAGGFDSLTEGLCDKAWTLFQQIEAAGGLRAALEQGFVQSEAAAAAAALARDVARLKSPLTGVSAHPFPGGEAVSVLPDAPAPIPPGSLAPIRLAEPFERLRAAAVGLPSVFLAAVGPLAAHMRRVGFAREAFESAGVATAAGAGASDAETLAAEFRASGAGAACLCGTDEAYAERAENFATALKAAGARAVYLAGRPGEREAAWRAAGVDGFVFAGADMVAALQSFIRNLGAPASGLSGRPSP